MLGMLRSLWMYRHFVLSSIKNEFVSMFARSGLGAIWMIIHPLSQVAIYALILSNVLAARLPDADNQYSYAIYLMSGLLGWTLFIDIINRCTTLFINQGNLMKKVSFPRITLPVIAVGSAAVNNILLCASLLLIFVLLGHSFTFYMLWLIPLTLLTFCFALSIGLILGIINVFLRDIGQIVPIVLQVWFWFTPIVYPLNIIPEKYRHLLDFNPAYPLINGYQEVLLYGKPPAIQELIILGIISIILLLVGLFMFRQASAEMVDAL